MLIVDIIVRWLHLMAAFTWVGGLIFVNLVLTPAVKPKGIPPQFIRLMAMERFRWFAWGSIIVVIMTGVYNTLQSVPTLLALTDSNYGLTLLLKIIAVAAMVMITILNSTILKKRIVQAPPGPGGTPPPELESIGGRLVIFSRLNLGLGFLVVLLAAMLRYGI